MKKEKLEKEGWKQVIAGVYIKQLLDKAKLGDLRGSTYEWKEITAQNIVQLSIYNRKSGVTFANHFHKGADPSKNPELFVVTRGEVEVAAYNNHTQERDTFTLTAGMVIALEPYVLHVFKALSDVCLVEPRVTCFNEQTPDTYPAEEYELVTI